MANANKKAKAAGKTRRGIRNNDLKEKQFLLSQLPGKNLKLKDFQKMLGQSCLKSNQIKNIKDLSTNLQNIFRLNQNKSEFDFRYYSENSFNKKTSNILKNVQL